jgi:hypothetical protein
MKTLIKLLQIEQRNHQSTQAKVLNHLLINTVAFVTKILMLMNTRIHRAPEAANARITNNA